MDGLGKPRECLVPELGDRSQRSVLKGAALGGYGAKAAGRLMVFWPIVLAFRRVNFLIRRIHAVMVAP